MPREQTGAQPEIRAFPLFDEVPAGHYLYPVTDDRNEPHIRRGEFVVVDASDRDATLGELYLVLQSVGPVIWQIVKFTHGKIVGDDRPHVILCPLQHRFPVPKGSILAGINLSDGPLAIDDLKVDLLGRVVGLLDPRERLDRKLAQARKRRAGQ